MKSPILITGCARSGTSLVAGIVNICGAFGGKMSGPNNNNQKGMFENAFIRNSIVKPYLAHELGVDKLGQFPLPNIEELMPGGDRPLPNNWRRKIEDVIKNEGYPENAPWFYKGAKMCLIWPIWHHAFPDAKWIIVRRKTSDIVNSCIRTGFMRAFAHPTTRKAVGVSTVEDGWLWWVRQHEARFSEMIMEGLNVKQIWPERMVERDYRQANEMLDWLGLEWNDKIFDFIEPRLWKPRHKLHMLDEPVK